ncbi:hypothetical protein FZEAL_2500 [Fusarium zealandicum]|uniref:Hydrophobin n=1 Tax=Fusarium zealandicum TaxID=1053134 RepID=A0A8H4URD0_9HYPO|nr:hypothetical protein FZEAL_2500 [Fusarium zealandicum]
MKAAAILALPILALAAATPKVEERQVPGLPNLPDSPLDLSCLLRIRGIQACVPGGVTDATILPDLLNCSVIILIRAFTCIIDEVN